jgi:hypothetical protein
MMLSEIFGRVDKVLAIVGNDVNLREGESVLYETYPPSHFTQLPRQLLTHVATGWMSDVLDQVVRTRAFHYFLLTGKLISAQDETYVQGLPARG